uniref:C-type lectin 1 n=1 Tax=Anadara kagoshimensis TaxID=1390362 RepID=A0A7G7XXY3_9BIVA|nr:C-type lectin 1 [Anadara sativa]
MLLLKTVVVITLIVYCSSSYSCPGVWEFSLGTSCYKFLNGNYTWVEASVQCRLIGGHLAMITSKEENAFIRGYAVRHQSHYSLYRFWLDGKDDESENHWYWDWNAVPIKFFNWNPGQPDNAGSRQDCLTFFTGGTWDDYMCDGVSHAICETEYVDTNTII